MTKISREELLKIARMSNVDVHEDEIAGLTSQMESILTYSERVMQVAADVDMPSSKNVNVFREDVILRTYARPILDQAPMTEHDYFVVPAILDKPE